MARFVSNDQLFSLVKPIADKAAELRTFKNLQKIKEMFGNILLVLLDNKPLDVVASLIFISGIIKDKLDNDSSRSVNPSLGDGKVENVSIFIVNTILLPREQEPWPKTAHHPAIAVNCAVRDCKGHSLLG